MKRSQNFEEERPSELAEWLLQQAMEGVADDITVTFVQNDPKRLTFVQTTATLFLFRYLAQR